MDRELYKAAVEGNPDFLRGRITGENDLLLRTANHNNNAVHIASKFGHLEFVKEALRVCPSLLLQQNKRGDTPLHVAASAGRVRVVVLLIETFKSVPTLSRTENPLLEEGEGGTGTENLVPLWRMKTWENNTALHEALRYLHQDVALLLLRVDRTLASFVNDSHESPLFLAAEAGFLQVLQQILSYGPPFTGDGPHNRTPLHAAALSTQPLTQRSACIKALIRKMPEAINEKDAFGKTALHYAAEGNSTKIIRLIMEKDVSSAYIADNDGKSPLLIAASSGHHQAVQCILDYCPDSVELVDKSSQNAMHLVVTNCYRARVRRFLKIPIMKELLNKPDVDGNTPLHLATKRHYYLLVKELVQTECVDLRAKNKNGFTALDICESEWEVSYQQGRLWTFLKQHKASRGGRFFPITVPAFRFRPRFHPKANLKGMADTLSVVAALLATLTFAAAFTVPGGYTDDGPNPGVAILAKKAAFKAFVLFDTIALCCSMTVLLLLMRAMVGDPTFLIRAVNFCAALLSLSFLATLAAFVTGIYTALSPKSLWLCIIVILLGFSVPCLERYLRTASTFLALPAFLRDKTVEPVLDQ